MPSPKSGSAGSAVSPTDSNVAEEADKADPGEMAKIKAEQIQTGTGKYGSTTLKPLKQPSSETGGDEFGSGGAPQSGGGSSGSNGGGGGGGGEDGGAKKSWIEIELRDQKGKTVPGEPYKVILADGETAAEGTLDEKGFARIVGIDPGTCKVSFPKRDKSCWKKK